VTFPWPHIRHHIIMTDLTIKKGASLQLLIAVANDDNSAFDLTGVTVSSQVKTAAGKPIATLTVTPTGTPGQLSVLQATDTWPTGPAVMDLKFVSGDVVLKSETQSLLITDPVTS
jgi:hypothetical protein